MKRFFYGLIGLLIASICQAQTLTTTGAGSVAKVATGGGAFLGPVDAIASPLGCWSLRACTAALRGNAVANVCVTGTCADMLSDATTGNLVTQTINGVSCPNNSGNCLVRTLYFQTGSLSCPISCNLLNAGLNATNPVLSNSCGSLAKSFCILFVAGNSTVLASQGTATASQPLTLIAVAMQTGALGANNGVVSINSNQVELSFEASGSALAFIYAGSSLISQSQTINAWHSLIGVANGANSAISVDGAAQTTGNAGSNAASSGIISLGTSAFSEYMTGDVVEVLLYPTAFTSGNDTSMCHNQFAYWGTSTSC